MLSTIIFIIYSIYKKIYVTLIHTCFFIKTHEFLLLWR
nr:MAG TPA: hypothetical protein [Caudoviricetes sp.]